MFRKPRCICNVTQAQIEMTVHPLQGGQDEAVLGSWDSEGVSSEEQ